jgi:hypothetical protein
MSTNNLPKLQTFHEQIGINALEFITLSVSNMKSRTIKSERIDNVKIIYRESAIGSYIFAVQAGKETFPVSLQVSDSGKSLMVESPKMSPDLLIAMYDQIEDWLEPKYHHRLDKLRKSACADRVKKLKNDDLDKILTDRFTQFVDLRILDMNSFIKIKPEQMVQVSTTALANHHKKVNMSFTMHNYSNNNVKDYLTALHEAIVLWTNYILANCVELTNGKPFTPVNEMFKKLDGIKSQVNNALEVINK